MVPRSVLMGRNTRQNAATTRLGCLAEWANVTAVWVSVVALNETKL